MSAPTPIHRDPDVDDDDYGCVGKGASKGNAAVAWLVNEARGLLIAGRFRDSDAFVDFVQMRLEETENRYDCGCCDTIVKENVFAALHDAVQRGRLRPVSQSAVYGW